MTIARSEYAKERGNRLRFLLRCNNRAQHTILFHEKYKAVIGSGFFATKTMPGIVPPLSQLQQFLVFELNILNTRTRNLQHLQDSRTLVSSVSFITELQPRLGGQEQALARRWQARAGKAARPRCPCPGEENTQSVYC